jgi:hypothetical protein
MIILFFLTFNLTSYAQSTNFIGNYEVRYDAKNAVIEYMLSLNSDGTFFFHSYENHFKATPPEKNKYGKGTWKAKKNIITFFANREKDIDEKHTLNFSNSKARFISKSPRDNSDRIIKTALKFLDSDIFWVKGMDIYKKD